MSASLIGRLGSSAFRLSTNSSVDVAHGLSLLFGIGTRGPSIMGFEDEVEQSLARPCCQSDGGPSGHANSPHPSSREGHHSTARWTSSFLLSHLILYGFHAAAVARSRVHRNSVPST